MGERKKVNLIQLQRKAFEKSGCPECGSKLSDVQWTRKCNLGITRSRVCVHCGNKYRTMEVTLK